MTDRESKFYLKEDGLRHLLIFETKGRLTVYSHHYFLSDAKRAWRRACLDHGHEVPTHAYPLVLQPFVHLWRMLD